MPDPSEGDVLGTKRIPARDRSQAVLLLVGKKAAGNGSAAFRNAGKPVGTGKSEASRPAKKKTIRNVHKKK